VREKGEGRALLGCGGRISEGRNPNWISASTGLLGLDLFRRQAL
jgi:hypothetical protein